MKKSMKNKKGFTLVELLAVIVILGVILSITLYIAINVIDKAKNKTYEVTINNIVANANSYLLENSDKVAFVSDSGSSIEYSCISVQNLVDTGYLDNLVTKSKVATNKSVAMTDNIYAERNKSSKAVTKVIYGISGSAYGNMCNVIANAKGVISFATNPDANTWAKEKAATITYNLNYINKDDSFSNYKYDYIFDTNSHDGVFRGFSEAEDLTVRSEGTILARITGASDGRIVVSRSYYVSKIDREGPVASLKSEPNGTVSREGTYVIKVTDAKSGVKYDSFTKEDLVVTIGDATISSITFTNNNDGTYTLVVSDTTHYGAIKIKVKGNSIFDNVDNGNLEQTLTPSAGWKAICLPPTNISIATDRKVSFMNSVTASGYEISIDGTNWQSHTNGSVFSKITDATGSRTVYVRSVCDTNNYNNYSENATGETTVYKVTLTKGTNISSVSGAGNYITGATINIDATASAGYSFDKWTKTSDGSNVSSTKAYSFTLSGVVNYTANAKANTNTPYKVKHYVHDIGTDTYTLNSTDDLTGTTGATLTIDNLKKTITGATYENGYTSGGTTKPSGDAETSTTILANGTRVINLYYRRNRLYIQYHVNGGSLADQHGSNISIENSLVKSGSYTKFLRGVYGSKVGSVTMPAYVIGTTGLDDYNNASYINIKRSGYSSKANQQWNTKADGTGTSYDQAVNTYNANGFAGANLDTGDKTVTLYVNWISNGSVGGTGSGCGDSGLSRFCYTTGEYVPLNCTGTEDVRTCPNTEFGKHLKLCIMTCTSTCGNETRTKILEDYGDCCTYSSKNECNSVANGTWNCSYNSTTKCYERGSLTCNRGYRKSGSSCVCDGYSTEAACKNIANATVSCSNVGTNCFIRDGFSCWSGYYDCGGKCCRTGNTGSSGSSGTGGGCFPAGTQVRTLIGYKDIDKVKVGDMILSYNEETGKNEYHKVTDTLTYKNSEIDETLYTVTFDDKSNLKITSSHYFYIIRDNESLWLATKDVRVGDMVKYADGKYHKIIDIANNELTETVYNLSVENTHNFYIGNQQVLVHNVNIVRTGSTTGANKY